MKKTSPGFALIETIVAIVLLAGVLSAAVGLLVGAGRASDRNRDRVTATFLAQEGLELARNARDTAWKMHLPYDCAFGGESLEPNETRTLIIKRIAENSNFDYCSGKNIGIQMLDAPTPIPGVLLPGKNDESKFQRTLVVKRSGTPDGVSVTAVISFPISGGGREEIKMGEILTDWRQK